MEYEENQGKVMEPIPQGIRVIRQMPYIRHQQPGLVVGPSVQGIRSRTIVTIVLPVNATAANASGVSRDATSAQTFIYNSSTMRDGQQAGQPISIHIQGQEPLSASVLAAAQPIDQKRMLGERLFPLIQDIYPIGAGILTGMILDMDNTEILHLLEDHELLNSRIQEAVAMISMHQSQQAGAQLSH